MGRLDFDMLGQLMAECDACVVDHHKQGVVTADEGNPAAFAQTHAPQLLGLVMSHFQSLDHHANTTGKLGQGKNTGRTERLAARLRRRECSQGDGSRLPCFTKELFPLFCQLRNAFAHRVRFSLIKILNDCT